MATVASAAALLAGGGVALAYWTPSGTGHGVGVVGDLTLTATAESISGVYPGCEPKAVPVTVRNPASRPLALTGITTRVRPSPAACPAGALSVVVPSAPGLPTIPKSGTVKINVMVSAPLDIPDACQAAKFGLSVTVTGSLQ